MKFLGVSTTGLQNNIHIFFPYFPRNNSLKNIKGPYSVCRLAETLLGDNVSQLRHSKNDSYPH